MEQRTQEEIEIHNALERIREAAGDYGVSEENPSGLIVRYNPDESKPWLLADDWVYDVFATAEEAEAAARVWGQD